MPDVFIENYFLWTNSSLLTQALHQIDVEPILGYPYNHFNYDHYHTWYHYFFPPYDAINYQLHAQYLHPFLCWHKNKFSTNKMQEVRNKWAYTINVQLVLSLKKIRKWTMLKDGKNETKNYKEASTAVVATETLNCIVQWLRNTKLHCALIATETLNCLVQWLPKTTLQKQILYCHKVQKWYETTKSIS